MPTVNLTLPHHQYAIHIGAGLLAELGDLVRAVAPHRQAALFADAAVFDTHALAAVRSLQKADYQVLSRPVVTGEEYKNLDAVRYLYDALLNARLERQSPVIALGGGITGDTVGFVAATYLRGVPFVQCPTTLLAMVDASIGGKVGVNVPQGKNLIGAFYQPVLVVIDTAALATLPARELRCGLAECVKHAVIRDPALFNWIEDNLDSVLALNAAALLDLVHRNVAIKAAVVMADEKESGQRAHLNFGHTFAHAIESAGPEGFGGAKSYHHGEAVSLGMVAATRLSVQTGRCESALLDRLTALLRRIGLPVAAPDLAATSALLDAMRLDKKVTAGNIRLVLPEALGSVAVVSDVPDGDIVSAWEALRQ
jgi:3-dehydroquinate synthase